jgi:hypothetical protein
VVAPDEEQWSRLEHGRSGFEKFDVPGVHSHTGAVEGTAQAVATALRALLLPVDIVPQLNDQVGLPFCHALGHFGELPVVGITAVLEAVVERTAGLHATAGVSNHGYPLRILRDWA